MERDLSTTIKKKYIHFNKTDHNTIDAATASVSGSFSAESIIIGSQSFDTGTIVIGSSPSGSGGTTVSDSQEDIL